MVSITKAGIASVLVGTALIGAQLVGSVPAFAGAYLTLNSFSGTPGSAITVSGGGWNVGDTVKLYVGSASGNPVGTATVGSDSNFSTSLTIPASEPQGPLPIIGVDATTNYQATNSYYVVPLSTTISVTAPSHAPYATVQVSGTGFSPNEGITLSLGTATASATADSTGSFKGTIVVPMVPTGLYHIVATGNASNASSFDYFWVDQFYPSAGPSTYYLMPGASLSFTGSGFAPGESVSVTQKGSTTPLSTFTTDGIGSFTSAGSFAVPAADHGQTETFTLTGSKSGVSATTNVTIGDFYAYASPSSYYLLPGQTESFSGGGFAGGETVNVYVSGSTTAATSFVTDQSGSFLNVGGVLVPFGSSKTATFTLVGQTSSASASASTGVGSYYPSLTPSQYYVTPGTAFSVTGAGYAPNEKVTITVSGSASSTTAVTSAAGTVTAPVTIPFGSSAATISAVGSLSQAVGSITVQLAKFFPTVTPSSFYVYPGGQVSFTGTGFVPGETVTTTVGSASSTTAIANQYGNVTTATTTVPYTAKGTVSASIIGSLSQSPTTVSIGVGSLTPYLSSDAYSATQGGSAHVQGFSFAPGETVQVTAGSFSTTTVADKNGTTPAVAITLPYQVTSQLVSFTGLNSGAHATVTVSLQSYTAVLNSSSYYATQGSAVTITGTGFAPNEMVLVGIGTASTTVTATAKGAISTPLTLPYTSKASVQVLALGRTSGANAEVAIAFAPFAPQVSPSTYYTLPGTSVVFTGSGYAANETVTVTYNGTPVGTVAADGTGSFTYTYMIPYGATKASVGFAGQTSTASVTDTLSLAAFSAYISLSNYYGIGGSPEVVTGSGFAPNELVTLSSNGSAFATTHATATGAISVATAIPYSIPGNMPINAVGASSGVVAGTSLTVAQVYPSFTLASYAGKPGASVTLNGSNFFATENVSLTTDRTGSTPVATFTTDASGSFSTSYALPTKFTEGTLVLTVKGAHSLTPESITYYVTGS